MRQISETGRAQSISIRMWTAAQTRRGAKKKLSRGKGGKREVDKTGNIFQIPWGGLCGGTGVPDVNVNKKCQDRKGMRFQPCAKERML